MHQIGKILLVSLLLFGCASARRTGEKSCNWFYRSWQTEDGLPSNSIKAVTQTSDGYLWLGTTGLLRFNGRDFSPITLHETLKLPSREVRSMFQDRTGRLWVAFERGPVVGLGEEDFISLGESDGLPPNQVCSITDDDEGRIWIAHRNKIFRVHDRQITSFKIPVSTASYNQPKLLADNLGQIWLTNLGKVKVFQKGQFRLVAHFAGASLRMAKSKRTGIWVTVDSSLKFLDSNQQLQPICSLPELSRVTSLMEDREGAVWICTQNEGLFRYFDGELEAIETSSSWVEGITQDEVGHIWVATFGGGLNVIRPRGVRMSSERDGFLISSFSSVTINPEGEIWGVNRDGQLAFQKGDQWSYYRPEEESVQFRCVVSDHQGRIWAGTKDHGIYRITTEGTQIFGSDQGLHNQCIRALFVSQNGDLWVGADRPGQLYHYSQGRFKAIQHQGTLDVIRGLVETADGTLWVGTSYGRLLRVQGPNLIEETDLGGSNLISIRTLHATSDGSLWIGYAGDGLGHLKDGKYRRITSKDGLYDDYISQIQDDRFGALWLAGNRGLSQVKVAQLLDPPERDTGGVKTRIFGRNDGLASFQFSRNFSPSSYQNSEGQIFFSTHRGLLRVDPSEYRADHSPPPVRLEKVTVDDRMVGLYHKRDVRSFNRRGADLLDLGAPDAVLEIAPDHGKVEIKFAALSLASPETVQINYRLRGLSEAWETADNHSAAHYTRLPAGKYLFEVIAANANGRWPQEKISLSITVSPFFWETWWFKLGLGALTALTAGGLVFIGLRRKHLAVTRHLRTRRALEQERSRIARDIHDDLGASLTRISLLAQPAEEPKEEAIRTKLRQIHATARQLMRSMDGVVWAINPEHDTLDDLANYLSSYAQEFLSAAGISCRIHIPVDLPEKSLSAQTRHNLLLACKEALNNIAKYAEASAVRITLQTSEHWLTLKIEDDGKGIDLNEPSKRPRPGSGRGLANMESRMKEISGTCKVESSPAKGTVIEFRIPFQENL